MHFSLVVLWILPINQNQVVVKVSNDGKNLGNLVMYVMLNEPLIIYKKIIRLYRYFRIRPGIPSNFIFKIFLVRSFLNSAEKNYRKK